MIDLDLGKYRADYHDFYKIGRNYMLNQIEDDSPFKVYETQKNNYGQVFLKVFDKDALKDEDDTGFTMERIQKEKEISYLCNSEYTLNLIRDFETEKNIVFEKEYCKSDLKEDLFNKGSIEKESKYLLRAFLSGHRMRIHRQIITVLRKKVRSGGFRGAQAAVFSTADAAPQRSHEISYTFSS